MFYRTVGFDVLAFYFGSRALLICEMDHCFLPSVLLSVRVSGCRWIRMHRLFSATPVTLKKIKYALLMYNLNTMKVTHYNYTIWWVLKNGCSGVTISRVTLYRILSSPQWLPQAPPQSFHFRAPHALLSSTSVPSEHFTHLQSYGEQTVVSGFLHIT